jgi:LuxR family maltose regulon positive regulatory protein
MEDGIDLLEQAVELARSTARPYIEIGCLGHLALAATRRSLGRARELAAQAIALAESHGWAAEPIDGAALSTMGLIEVSQGRFDEAQQWLDRADGVLRPELEPATAGVSYLARGILHVSQGRLDQAEAAFRTAMRLNLMLLSPHGLKVQTIQFLAQTLLRKGEIQTARETLSSLSNEEREWGEARVAAGALQLAEGNDKAAVEAVSPVLQGTAPVLRELTVIQALLVDAIARDKLGDRMSAESDVERALDLAEPDRLIFAFVMMPARELLERHPQHRTAHASLLADILDALAGSSLPAPAAHEDEMHEKLSESELRILRHLPSNLSAPEIAAALFVSTSTVKTHMQHVYAKLGVHKRTEAVERARELGLLGASRRPL